MSHFLLDELGQDLVNDLLVQSKLFLDSFLEFDLKIVILEVKFGEGDVFGQALNDWLAVFIGELDAAVTDGNCAHFQTLAERVEQGCEAAGRQPSVVEDKRLHGALLREKQAEVADNIVTDTLVIAEKELGELDLTADDLPNEHLHVKTRQSSAAKIERSHLSLHLQVLQDRRA